MYFNRKGFSILAVCKSIFKLYLFLALWTNSLFYFLYLLLILKLKISLHEVLFGALLKWYEKLAFNLILQPITHKEHLDIFLKLLKTNLLIFEYINTFLFKLILRFLINKADCNRRHHYILI